MRYKTKPAAYKQYALASRWVFVVCMFASFLGLQAQVNSLDGGTVIAWGDNTAGQVSVPPGLKDVVAIAAGGRFSLALKTDGSVVGWGNNSLGQISIPAGLSDVISISAGAVHSLALKKDGTVIAWGENRFGKITVPTGLKDVIAISAGVQHSLALKKDGTVIGWGDNSSGQLSPPIGPSGIKAIAAGGLYSLALRQDGRVAAWGDNRFGQYNVPAGLTGVMAIAAGFGHNLALKRDGTVVEWGNNLSGQTSVASGLQNVVAIAAGESHSAALKADGTVVAWGYNLSGQAKVPVDLKDVVAIAAGTLHSLALIRARSPPVIDIQPKSQSVSAGADVTLSVVAKGTEPLEYRWFFNSQLVALPTQSSLVLPNVTPNQAGNYSVLIRNAFGAATSTVAKLTVLNPVASAVIVTTLAGSGAAGYVDSPGRAAQFNQPNDCFVAPDGIIYLADAFNHRLRRITPAGEVVTMAGSGAAGYLDGPATNAQFNFPLGIFVDSAGDIFVADTENNRIRKVSSAAFRTVSTISGSGQPGYVDGPGASAKFNFPNDLVLDSAGNIFVSEFNNHTIRKITPGGEVSTWIGNGAAGYADGTGSAARLNQPAGITIDKQGYLYVSEWGNQRIRKISPDGGKVSTLAGSGEAGFVDGPGSAARFNEPDDLAVDVEGNVFVVEHGNHAVRKITAEGVVTTVAGTGQAGYADGPGREAKFFAPAGLGIDPSGNLIVVDTGNSLIRKITFLRLPQIVGQPVSQTATAGATILFKVSATGDGVISYQWKFNGTNVTGGTSPTLEVKNVPPNAAGTYTVLVSNAAGIVSSEVATLTILSGNEFVLRRLPIYYTPNSLKVILEARPSSQTTVYAVEDGPPTGWVVGAISDAGLYDAANNKVKFGPFFDGTTRTLTYEFKPPPGETGQKEFKGTASADGQMSSIGGATRIDPAPLLHPADNSPADNRISIDELTAYGAAWRKGATWPIPPHPIPIDFVTRAGTLWRNGEDYKLDPAIPNAPLWWVNLPLPAPRGLQSFGKLGFDPQENSVVRSLPNVFVPTETFIVRIQVKTAASVTAYAIQDEIPNGWTIDQVSDGGAFDTVNHQLKWGPFLDNQSRLLSYQVTPNADTAQQVNFRGDASFDGYSVPIAGDGISRATTRLRWLRRTPGGDLELIIRGRIADQYVIETSTDLRNWQSFGAVTNTSGEASFPALISDAPGLLFYRVLRK